MDQKWTDDKKPEDKYKAKMTIISSGAYDKATIDLQSKEEAVEYLYDELIRRNVRNVIEKFSKGQDIKTIQKKLVDGLFENRHITENQNGKVSQEQLDKEKQDRESIKRRVRGWLNPNSVHSIDKKTAIEISFILNLSYEEAVEFISLISEEKLHWRNVEEIVYIYGLKGGNSYKDCLKVIESSEIQEVISNIEDYEKFKNTIQVQYTKYVKKGKKSASTFRIHFNKYMESLKKDEDKDKYASELGNFPDSEIQYVLTKIEDYEALKNTIKDEYTSFVKKKEKSVKEFKKSFSEKYPTFGSISKSEVRDLLARIKDNASLEKIMQNDETLKEIFKFQLTEFVEDNFKEAKLKDFKELKKYLLDNYKDLGTLHNTSYTFFMEMIRKLRIPTEGEESLGLVFGDFDEDKKQKNPDKIFEKYSIRNILLQYFYCLKWKKDENDKTDESDKTDKTNKTDKTEKYTLLKPKQKAALNVVQKVIARGWPDEVSLSKMKKRKMDVTRKCLILLFLATDGEYEEDDFGYEVEEDDFGYEVEEDELFGDVLERMNNMLCFCGYSELDPRNPFDWLIIYCIYVQDIFEIDSNMQGMIEELFRKEDEEDKKDKEDE